MPNKCQFGIIPFRQLFGITIGLSVILPFLSCPEASEKCYRYHTGQTRKDPRFFSSLLLFCTVAKNIKLTLLNSAGKISKWYNFDRRAIAEKIFFIPTQRLFLLTRL